MHNLHLVVTRADSPEDACSEVESHISDYGNDNNWRTIGGCVSEDNQVHIEDDGGSYLPDDESNTIEKINAMVVSWAKSGSVLDDEGEELMKKALNGDDLHSHDWWKISEYAKHKSSVAKFDLDNYNVLEDNHREMELDENGVTILESSEGEKQYVVFVDMHTGI